MDGSAEPDRRRLQEREPGFQAWPSSEAQAILGCPVENVTDQTSGLLLLELCGISGSSLGSRCIGMDVTA